MIDEKSIGFESEGIVTNLNGHLRIRLGKVAEKRLSVNHLVSNSGIRFNEAEVKCWQVTNYLEKEWWRFSWFQLFSTKTNLKFWVCHVFLFLHKSGQIKNKQCLQDRRKSFYFMVSHWLPCNSSDPGLSIVSYQQVQFRYKIYAKLTEGSYCGLINNPLMIKLKSIKGKRFGWKFSSNMVWWNHN